VRKLVADQRHPDAIGLIGLWPDAEHDVGAFDQLPDGLVVVIAGQRVGDLVGLGDDAGSGEEVGSGGHGGFPVVQIVVLGGGFLAKTR
jgi:hypothetical protein